MIGLNLQADVSQVLEHLRSVQPQVRRAASAAINRTAEAVRTVARRKIAEDTGLPQKDISRKLVLKRASPLRLEAEVRAYPYAPNIGRYGKPAQNKVGTAATGWRKRKTYKSAFKYKGTNRVVTRVGKERFPLKSLKGPSVRKQFTRRETIDAMDARARFVFRDRFRRELARRVSAFSSAAE